MTVADDLRVLVDEDYPEMVDNLNIILTKLGESKTEIENEIITINDGVLDAAEADHLAALEAKRVANGWALVITFGDYGVLNLTDWFIYGFNGSPLPATFQNSSTFRVNAVISNPTGSPVLMQPGNVQGIILSRTFGPPQPPPPPPPVYTFTDILLTTAVVPVGITTADFASNVYSPTVNWDSDTNISDHQDAFAIGYDQLNHELGVSGTYGLIPKRDQIDLGISIQTINRDAYQSFIDNYEPYAA